VVGAKKVFTDPTGCIAEGTGFTLTDMTLDRIGLADDMVTLF
jgi:hypothetical protein